MSVRVGSKNLSRGSLFGIRRLAETIRIYRECEGMIAKSVSRIAVWHHKACRLNAETIRIYHECECRIEKSVLRIAVWQQESC